MKRKRIILAFVLMLALVFGSVPARMSATASEPGGGAGAQEPGAGNTAAPDVPQKKKLDTPTDLKWDGSTVTWKAVSGASSYEVVIYKDNTRCEARTTSDCLVLMAGWRLKNSGGVRYIEGWSDSGDGVYYFEVRAIDSSNSGNSSDWAQSPTMEVNRTELPAPTNLRWEGNAAVWDPPVTGTSNYRFKYRMKLLIGGIEQGPDTYKSYVTEPKVDELIRKDGNYSFQVQAEPVLVEDTLKYKASQWSVSSPTNQVNTGKKYLNPPSTLGWDGNAAKWSTVEGAKGYLVDSGLPDVISLGTYTESNTLAIARRSDLCRYRVKAIAGEGNETYNDSVWSEWSEVKKIELTPLGTPTNLRWKGSVGVWDPVEGASSYSVLIYRDDVRVGSYSATEPEASEVVDQGGKYKFKVYALAVGSLTYEWSGGESEFSAELNWEPNSSSDASPSPKPSSKPSASPTPEPTATPAPVQTPEPTATPAPVQTPEPTKKPGGWATEEDGGKYWYEDGVKQGTEGCGKEIFDPETNEWYWLDAESGGRIAVSKDVYQEDSAAGSWAEDEDGGTGKWVRYDKNGHMVKGWDSNENGTYYFDLTFGTMAKGYVTIEGDVYYFDKVTGTGTGKPCSKEDVNGWVVTENGNRLWYEGGERQGTEGRGKEIYDPETDGWYWLDSVDGGKRAIAKDVYQESAAGAWAEKADGTGKWVRYDKKGHMVKGWDTNENGTYYFDLVFGTMAKGTVSIDGKEYQFDVITGIMIAK